MKLQQLTSDGPAVSSLSLGSWNTYSRLSFEAGCELLQTAVNLGVNFFDVAYYRDKPHTEVLFGRMLEQLKLNRTEYVIAEKVWFFSYPAMPLREQLERSLVRLAHDYSDIVFVEAPRPGMDLAQIADELAGLVEAGLARQWGVLNWSAAQLQTAVDRARTTGRAAPVMAQLKYSVARRSIVESDSYQRLFNTEGIGLHASDTMEGGVLAGKINQTRRIGVDTGGIRQQIIDRAPLLKSIADELGSVPAAVAIAFCLTNSATKSVLFGATRPEQLEANIDALRLIDEHRERLLELVEPLAVSGHTDEAPYEHVTPLTEDFIA